MTTSSGSRGIRKSPRIRQLELIKRPSRRALQKLLCVDDPAWTFSQAMTANQQGLDAFANWQYRYLPYRAQITVTSNATTVGVRETVTTGSMTVKQKSPVQGGGTAGVFGTMFNAPVYSWVGEAGDLISWIFDEVAGGTPTVNLWASIDPA